ncbi:aromatic ring-hydroxylating dioxygenase subunit alpha [Solitalea sp. MAHUQ-68]|uniref:Aromatic ring-hydroxylating dioxygenase subunit alpha n=1 Tax=Solitalea agri TaxID=2953739 RepID=A0A9X2EZ58_9SPHI|nr:aromatic ring-hydroxylating dioxygenase subunit alpha [Solitalea agri]MCO4291737.1 aromatic ring-hydroxylating dioxygenase subunit alpha [Solitalea agri]
MEKLNIHPDITKAETLPTSFYKSIDLFEESKEKIFAKSWQLIESEEYAKQADEAFPFSLLQGFLNEPLVLVRNQNHELNCFSNVCTHRGNILVHHPGKYKKFICNYHGRKFNIDGQFESMPEFKEAKDFPRACDDLHQIDVKEWSGFPFVSLNPGFDFDILAAILNERVGFMPVSQFQFRPELSREYLVNAHWALYCDNYLEGFHVPFVHPDLNKVLDYQQYKTLIYDYCNLQIGIGDHADECFDLPKNHVDHGQKIAAYYYWLFPNMMLNFYPWGLSLNIVKPISIKQCKVKFLTYMYDESKYDKGAGALLDKVEREDEFVVENVQRGINSRFYKNGRFSPTREQGVHHFHSLLSRFINS